MPDNKTVLDGTANAASVLVFMTYLSERHCKSGKGAGKDVLDKKSLEVAMEALADLKVQQMALEPHRFTSPEDRRYVYSDLFKNLLSKPSIMLCFKICRQRIYLLWAGKGDHLNSSERASTHGCAPKIQITIARPLTSQSMGIH